MKVLVIGDCHCREIWKELVKKEYYCDKIVFLGDYTTPREVVYDDPTDACGFLYEILDFKDQNPDKVVLLRGNHCLCSLGYYWAECSPRDHPNVERYWQTKDVKNWYLKNTQWVYRIPDTNIVCSHAGISEEFLNNCDNYLARKWFLGSAYEEYTPQRRDWLIEEINWIEPCELFAFTPCKLYDYNGDSSTQPCTWIRPYTLLHHGIKGITQVVGHTPTKHICNLKDSIINQAIEEGLYETYKESYESYCDVWVCDCLENREYLIIEDEEFKPCKL